MADGDEDVDRIALLDDASIEAIARRVAELLTKGGGGQLVSAGEIAEQLGVERSWVYANARLLGAIRLSEGPRAQLRFDVDRAVRALRERGAADLSKRSRRRPPRRRRAVLPDGVELLEGRRNKTL
jgi:hypothetical protein